MILPERRLVTTTDPTDTTDAQVSSFYGSGALSAWLLIVASVVVSWTANLTTRRKDVITNDFLAALTMPIVAAAHIFYLIRQDLDTTAPLYVCWTFNSFSWILLIISAFREHVKRLLLVAHVGALCVLAEHLSHNSVHTRWQANLLEFVCPITAAAVDFYMVYRRIPSSFHHKLTLDSATAIVLWFMLLVLGWVGMWFMTEHSTLAWSIYRIGALPFRRLTTTSFTDLDQAAAFTAGFVTLAFSVWDAWRSRRLPKPDL